MNAFLLALANIIQAWTVALPTPLIIQPNDQISGLLLFLAITLNASATNQNLPDPNGNVFINPLINFWPNINAFLNPAQNPQIATVIGQGFIDQNTINLFLGRIDQPNTLDITAALRAVVGWLAIQGQTADPRYRWALLFLLFWSISFGVYNVQDTTDLYNYLFLNGPKPQKVGAIVDPIIVRLLPAGGGFVGQGNFGGFGCGGGFNGCGGCCGGCGGGGCGNNPFLLPNTCGQKCPDIFWQCNSTDPCCCDCVQRRPPPCQPCPKGCKESCDCDDDWDDEDCDEDCDEDVCEFPKAICFLFERLGQQAKKTLQCKGNPDWDALSCILKKMLVLGMFSKDKKKCKCGGKEGKCTCGCKKRKDNKRKFGCGGNCQGGWQW